MAAIRHNLLRKCKLRPRSGPSSGDGVTRDRGRSSLERAGSDFIMLPSPREYEYLLDKRSVITAYASKVSTSLASDAKLRLVDLRKLPRCEAVQLESLHFWRQQLRDETSTLLAVRHFDRNENIMPARRAGERQNPIIDSPFRIDCRRSPRKTTSAALGKETLRWIPTN